MTEQYTTARTPRSTQESLEAVPENAGRTGQGRTNRRAEDGDPLTEEASQAATAYRQIAETLRTNLTSAQRDEQAKDLADQFRIGAGHADAFLAILDGAMEYTDREQRR
ncbi:hypothetical protein ACFV2X_43005 [Streptomyces sp. NPDC059679]|uniref:hypothetical protein n=1 Tax=Streptomyces sp. NPDC059679 TaxID=3346903 RepID=UPI0036C6F4A6